jgi:putative ABC transport system substrate-binding protein
LALLNELMPSARKVALIRHSANVALDLQVGETRAASSQLGIDLVVFELGGAQELEGAFCAAKQQGASAMMALSDPMAANNSARIVSLSFKYRIPVVSPYMHMAKAGAVLAYGPNRALLYRRAASLVARVLKGAKPGDLPIEQPNQFDLVINIKSGKALVCQFPKPCSRVQRTSFARSSKKSRVYFRLLAPLRHAERLSECPLIAEDRK